MAVVLGLPAPGGRLGRARDHRPARRPSIATTSTRWLAEITVATRLVIVCNPNNPTSTALPLSEIAAFLDARCRAHVCVIVDEAYCEFNLLEDPDASLDLLDAHPNLVLLRTFSKVHGLCGLRVGFALCGSERAAPARRPGAPAVLLQRARAGGRDRGAGAPGRGRSTASRATSPSASRSTSACARWASRPPTRRPTSAGSRCGAGRDEEVDRRGLQSAACSSAAAAALGGAGALRVTYGTPEENARFLDALAEVL